MRWTHRNAFSEATVVEFMVADVLEDLHHPAVAMDHPGGSSIASWRSQSSFRRLPSSFSRSGNYRQRINSATLGVVTRGADILRRSPTGKSGRDGLGFAKIEAYTQNQVDVVTTLSQVTFEMVDLSNLLDNPLFS